MKRQNTIAWLMLLVTPAVLGLCLLTGGSGFGVPSDENIFYLRLYRVAAGFIVGAGLSCAGALLQALLRNPLAEPYVLGVSSGAGLGAALAIVSGAARLGIVVLPFSAFICALVTLAIVYALSNMNGRLSVYGLILSGVIVSSFCSSILMFLITLTTDSGLHTIIWWMLGNLEMYSVPLLILCGALILSGSAGIWALAPELNALALGRDMAHHVGVRTRMAIAVGLALATLATASAVALAGLIGFVGLIVPHVIRRVIGPDHRRLIPCAALAGGVFLAVCDAVARTIMRPVEIPVGVITALVGGPFFLVILRGRRNRGWIE